MIYCFLFPFIHLPYQFQTDKVKLLSIIAPHGSFPFFVHFESLSSQMILFDSLFSDSKLRTFKTKTHKIRAHLLLRLLFYAGSLHRNICIIIILSDERRHARCGSANVFYSFPTRHDMNKFLDKMLARLPCHGTNVCGSTYSHASPNLSDKFIHSYIWNDPIVREPNFKIRTVAQFHFEENVNSYVLRQFWLVIEFKWANHSRFRFFRSVLCVCVFFWHEKNRIEFVVVCLRSSIFPASPLGFCN